MILLDEELIRSFHYHNCEVPKRLHKIVTESGKLCPLSTQTVNNRIYMHMNNKLGDYLFYLKSCCVEKLTNMHSNSGTEPLESLLNLMSLDFFQLIVTFYSKKTM
jgi:hypothetical protein